MKALCFALVFSLATAAQAAFPSPVTGATRTSTSFSRTGFTTAIRRTTTSKAATERPMRRLIHMPFMAAISRAFSRSSITSSPSAQPRSGFRRSRSMSAGLRLPRLRRAGFLHVGAALGHDDGSVEHGPGRARPRHQGHPRHRLQSQRRSDRQRRYRVTRTFLAPPAGYNMRYKDISQPARAAVQSHQRRRRRPSRPSSTPTAPSRTFSITQQVVLGELDGLDDLATETTYVRTNMMNIYTNWVGAADFDGFRMDTVKHVDYGFWQYWCPQLHQFATSIGKSNFFMFGEAFDGSRVAGRFLHGHRGRRPVQARFDAGLCVVLHRSTRSSPRPRATRSRLRLTTTTSPPTTTRMPGTGWSRSSTTTTTRAS